MRLAPWTLILPLAAACADGSATAPDAFYASMTRERQTLAVEVRGMAAARGLTPVPVAPPVRNELVELGRMLAFDPILSGNRDIACMTCHSPRHALGDARSLSIGTGAAGTGPDRVHPDGVFIARNAPPLFELSLLDRLFFDGRVAVDRVGRLLCRIQATVRGCESGRAFRPDDLRMPPTRSRASSSSRSRSTTPPGTGS